MTEPEDTRGLTLRELVIELRDGQLRVEKRMHEELSKRPTRSELVIAASVFSGVVLGIIAL
jgi:hypothetical protein